MLDVAALMGWIGVNTQTGVVLHSHESLHIAATDCYIIMKNTNEMKHR